MPGWAGKIKTRIHGIKRVTRVKRYIFIAGKCARYVEKNGMTVDLFFQNFINICTKAEKDLHAKEI